MSLPLQSTPTYTMEIPSTGKKVKFRPFLVKEGIDKGHFKNIVPGKVEITADFRSVI